MSASSNPLPINMKPTPIPSTSIDFTKQLDLSKLKDAHILITGGASGIGFDITRAVLEAGASVTIADFNESLALEATENLKQQGLTRFQFVQTDCKDYDSQLAAFKAAWSYSQKDTGSATGHIDVVIPSAGVGGNMITNATIPKDQPIDADPPKPDMNGLEVNLIGVYYSAVLALHYFHRMNMEQTTTPTISRQIIFISSMAGYSDMPMATAYNSSKFGVRGMFKSIRRSIDPHGGHIRVNLLAPWWIRTPMAENIIKRMGVKVPGEVQDVTAAALRFMCDDTIQGRAVAIGKSGITLGKEAGAFNFDLNDDPQGRDGGVAFWQKHQEGYFGELGDAMVRPRPGGAEDKAAVEAAFPITPQNQVNGQSSASS